MYKEGSYRYLYDDDPPQYYNSYDKEYGDYDDYDDDVDSLCGILTLPLRIFFTAFPTSLSTFISTPIAFICIYTVAIGFDLGAYLGVIHNADEIVGYDARRAFLGMMIVGMVTFFFLAMPLWVYAAVSYPYTSVDEYRQTNSRRTNIFAAGLFCMVFLHDLPMLVVDYVCMDNEGYHWWSGYFGFVYVWQWVLFSVMAQIAWTHYMWWMAGWCQRSACACIGSGYGDYDGYGVDSVDDVDGVRLNSYSPPPRRRRLNSRRISPPPPPPPLIPPRRRSLYSDVDDVDSDVEVATVIRRTPRGSDRFSRSTSGSRTSPYRRSRRSVSDVRLSGSFRTASSVAEGRPVVVTQEPVRVAGIVANPPRSRPSSPPPPPPPQRRVVRRYYQTKDSNIDRNAYNNNNNNVLMDFEDRKYDDQDGNDAYYEDL